MFLQIAVAIGFTTLFSMALFYTYKWFAWLIPQAIDFSLFENRSKKDQPKKSK